MVETCLKKNLVPAVIAFLLIVFYTSSDLTSVVIDYRKAQILEEKTRSFDSDIKDYVAKVSEKSEKFNNFIKSGIISIGDSMKSEFENKTHRETEHEPHSKTHSTTLSKVKTTQNSTSRESSETAFMTERFNQRNSILKLNCEKYLKSTGKSKTINTINTLKFAATVYGKNLDESKTWLACIQPKAGTTNWQKLLLKSSGNKSNKIDFEGPNSQNKGNKFFNLLDKVNGLSKNERITVLENSENLVKFLHVRNPFDRLYSAWHQKFNTSFPNKSQFKYYVNKMNIEHEIPDGMLCSFADFVIYFLKHPDSNFHWRNIFWQCQPCQIDYEFISKQESFQEDSDFIVREIYGKDASFKVEKAYTDSSKSVKKQVYSELAWLPDDLHKQLEKHFYWEMLVLGYTYPEY